MTNPSPTHGRIKRAVRTAISICGGVEGAAATVGKCKSSAGNWNALAQPDTPVVADALALDEIAVSQGKSPAILFALAAELGHVAVRLPDANCEGEMLPALTEASAQFGDIAHAICDATRTGFPKPAERDRIIFEIDEAHAALARLRAVVAKVAA